MDPKRDLVWFGRALLVIHPSPELYWPHDWWIDWWIDPRVVFLILIAWYTSSFGDTLLPRIIWLMDWLPQRRIQEWRPISCSSPHLLHFEDAAARQFFYSQFFENLFIFLFFLFLSIIFDILPASSLKLQLLDSCATFLLQISWKLF